MEDSGNDSFYISHIGLFYFFTACAGVSLIVWAFNWICWINQCCCCDFLHNPVNKRIAWWMSFSFLLGILACCISSFVSVNRFEYAVNGVLCSIDRIYYDTKNGELQGNTDGFDSSTDLRWKGTNNDEAINTAIDTISENFKNTKYKYKDKAKLIKICLGELARVYFWLLLIVVTFAGVSMMFYSCLKRQGYLIIFMHVLWNSIRFFMVSFFIFGTFYGKYYCIFQDSIGLVYNLFIGNDNVKDYIVPNNSTLKNCFETQNGNDKGMIPGDKPDPLLCKVIRRDVNILFWALYDASNQSQILCSLSLCSSFFGAIAVYFFLLVMHHYNNELFFDMGKSIFTGLEGFGGYKKRDKNQDPQYKKRKLRSELEMTSNDQNSNYKNINKNENDNKDE